MRASVFAREKMLAGIRSTCVGAFSSKRTYTSDIEIVMHALSFAAHACKRLRTEQMRRAHAHRR